MAEPIASTQRRRRVAQLSSATRGSSDCGHRRNCHPAPGRSLHFAFTPFAPALTRRRTPRVHTAAELAIVATIVQFVFPPGTGPRGWALWGTDFNQWSSLQYGFICDFGFVSMIHVMLHWSWVCTIVARRLLKQTEIPDDGIQTILGAGLLIGLLRLVHSLSERP